MALGDSVRVSCLMNTALAPASAAEARMAACAQLRAAKPGRRMIIAPRKPTIVAVQRRARTTSPRNSTAAIVANSGPVNDSAVDSLSGRYAMPVNQHNIEAKLTTDRQK